MKILSLLLITFLLTACGGGGGGSSSNDESTPTNDDDQIETVVVPTTQDEADAYVLERLAGLWKGSLKTYIDGTDTVQCEWEVSLNLSSTKIPDSEPTGLNFASQSSSYLGSAIAELIFAQGEDSDRCISDNFDLDWDAYCGLAPTVTATNEIAYVDAGCDLDVDRNPTDFVSIARGGVFLEGTINRSELPIDRSRMFLERNDIDDPSMNLTRSE